MKKIDISSASAAYISGMILAAVTIFILSGVIFLLLIANRLDIVMSSPSAVTYTYFMMIMDRILLFGFLFWVLPVSIYQWTSVAKSENKTHADKGVTALSIIILLVYIVIFISGELHFLDKYKDGSLFDAGLFNLPTVETQIFDKIQ